MLNINSPQLTLIHGNWCCRYRVQYIERWIVETKRGREEELSANNLSFVLLGRGSTRVDWRVEDLLKPDSKEKRQYQIPDELLLILVQLVARSGSKQHHNMMRSMLRWVPRSTKEYAISFQLFFICMAGLKVFRTTHCLCIAQINQVKTSSCENTDRSAWETGGVWSMSLKLVDIPASHLARHCILGKSSRRSYSAEREAEENRSSRNAH